MNTILIIIGWSLCIPAIVFGPIVKLFPSRVNRPWVDGLVKNTLRAYAKYDTKSWIRRMIGIYHNPYLTLQYLTILSNKQEVVCVGVRTHKVKELYQMHDVQTNHGHHQKRINDAKEGVELTSDYGWPIVVGHLMHDGNHRLAAYKEAGAERVKALTYLPVKYK